MKNYVQPGNTVTAIAPTGGVTSGDGVLIGELCGVATGTAAATEEFEMQIEGVVNVPKLTTAVLAAGDRVFWDPTPGEVNDTATAQQLAGIAVVAAGNGGTTVDIKLTPGAVPIAT